VLSTAANTVSTIQTTASSSFHTFCHTSSDLESADADTVEALLTTYVNSKTSVLATLSNVATTQKAVKTAIADILDTL
jgi:hypothetical protein